MHWATVNTGKHAQYVDQQRHCNSSCALFATHACQVMMRVQYKLAVCHCIRQQKIRGRRKQDTEFSHIGECMYTGQSYLISDNIPVSRSPCKRLQPLLQIYLTLLQVFRSPTAAAQHVSSKGKGSFEWELTSGLKTMGQSRKIA